MIFLIDYDRHAGKIITMRTFDDASVQAALDARLSLELDTTQLGTEREIVLFDAPNEAALRKTHGRYFKNSQELINETFAAIR